MTTPLMTTTSSCGCTSAASSPCDTPALAGLERTRFFARQLVMPDDLTQDQIYFREKERRHNRMLHGWGVVCGSCVTRGSAPCEVIVDAGYILGPYGDEIVIDTPVTIDLCKQGLGERNGCCGEELDPWCADTQQQCPEGPLYLAVRYKECQSRPVRSMSAACGCGCDDSACEYSRIRDSYAIKLLRDLPSSYTTPMTPAPASALVPCRDGTARKCPPCPTDPWVILADITLSSDCKVRSVDCFAHRRYVMSYGSYYRICPPAGAPSDVYTVGSLDAISMVSMTYGSSALVDMNATSGATQPRATVQVTRADGSSATVPANFTVTRGSTVADMLQTNGDRQMYDPVTNRTYTLRDLYTAAQVNPSTRVDSTAGALGLLEDRMMAIMTPAGASTAGTSTAGTSTTGTSTTGTSTTGTSTTGTSTTGGTSASGGTTSNAAAARAGATGNAAAPAAKTASSSAGTSALSKLVDREGLDRLTSEHGGDLAKAGALPVTALVGIATTSAVGKAVGNMTIADVSAMSRDDFVAHATEGMSKRQVDRAREQAQSVWDNASRVAKIAGGKKAT